MVNVSSQTEVAIEIKATQTLNLGMDAGTQTQEEQDLLSLSVLK